MATKKSIEEHNEIKWPYGKKNYIVFAIAFVVILAGFFTLSSGSDTLAPFLLVLGYLVLIPIALMIKDDSVTEQSSDSEISD